MFPLEKTSLRNVPKGGASHTKLISWVYIKVQIQVTWTQTPISELCNWTQDWTQAQIFLSQVGCNGFFSWDPQHLTWKWWP